MTDKSSHRQIEQIVVEQRYTPIISVWQNAKKYLSVESQQAEYIQIYTAASKKILNLMKEDGKSKFIPQLLHIERLILSSELQGAILPQQKSSLKLALIALEDCQTNYNLINDDPVSYKKAVPAAYSTKNSPDGLPLDAAREFFKGHSVRLNNYLKSPSLNNSDSLMLKQRKTNIKVLEEFYIELQRDVLRGNIKL